MPNTDYRFPHVAVSKYAVPRTPAAAEESNAPVMFAPFRAVKGPSNELKTVYTLGEFTNLYGAESFDDYSDNHHELLAISNWLSEGGAVIALRLTGTKDKAASSGVFGISGKDGGAAKYTGCFEAKYPGAFYRNLKINITKPSNDSLLFSITSNDRKTEYEKFQVKENTFESLIAASEYIKIADAAIGETGATTDTKTLIRELINTTREEFNSTISSREWKATVGEEGFPTTASLFISIVNSALIITLSSYEPGNPVNSTEALLFNLLAGRAATSGDKISGDLDTLPAGVSDKLMQLLLNKLETPIDVFFDGDYSLPTKRVILKKFAYPRDDIHFFMNHYEAGNDESAELTSTKIAAYITDTTGYDEPLEEGGYSEFTMRDADGNPIDFQNVSFYAQYVVVNNSYTDSDIKVGPTYFLSQLVAYNDIHYGTQYPTAGLNRGVLVGAKSLSLNPDPDIKNALYDAKTNYIERDSRGYRFMCQLTRGLENTALSYVNNARTTNLIATDIEAIGRKYLFEFNDTTTLGNMKTEMNKYLNQWVQNRTLSLATVEVEKISANSVEVQLGITFVGTIEIIAVAITIE